MRRTGRTTRMLLRAAIAISEGERVVLVGHDARHSSRLQDELRSILVRLGIPFSDKQLLNRGAADSELRNESGAEVFVDHFAIEQGLGI